MGIIPSFTRIHHHPTPPPPTDTPPHPHPTDTPPHQHRPFQPPPRPPPPPTPNPDHPYPTTDLPHPHPHPPTNIPTPPSTHHLPQPPCSYALLQEYRGLVKPERPRETWWMVQLTCVESFTTKTHWHDGHCPGPSGWYKHFYRNQNHECLPMQTCTAPWSNNVDLLLGWWRSPARLWI